MSVAEIIRGWKRPEHRSAKGFPGVANSRIDLTDSRADMIDLNRGALRKITGGYCCVLAEAGTTAPGAGGAPEPGGGAAPPTKPLPTVVFC